MSENGIRRIGGPHDAAAKNSTLFVVTNGRSAAQFWYSEIPSGILPGNVTTGEYAIGVNAGENDLMAIDFSTHRAVPPDEGINCQYVDTGACNCESGFFAGARLLREWVTAGRDPEWMWTRLEGMIGED